ncbi:hypothetical protein ACFLZ7_02000 [Nanoarchaeota archaeon]
MDRGLAELLVEGIAQNPAITDEGIKLDQGKLVDFLVKTNVPESSRFQHVLPDNEQSEAHDNKKHYSSFSLRRVLRNKRVGSHHLLSLVPSLQELAHMLSFYSSTVISRRIRENPDFNSRMKGCDHPYSLLGKLTVSDYNNDQEHLYRMIEPVVIIPGAQGGMDHLFFQRFNRTYLRQKGEIGWFSRVEAEECPLG